MRKRVAIVGSTGSIGTQALELIAANPEEFEVVALAAGGGQPRLLAEQALQFSVPVIAVSRATAAQDVQLALYAAVQRRGWATGEVELPKLLAGPTAASEVAQLDCDVVLNAMTGAVGLEPTIAALRAGRTLALANKESLIIGGDVVKRLAAPGQIVPVDSEHSALAQALRGEDAADVSRLILTASGGPFRGKTRAELVAVTPEQAMAHPTWDMGPVITINSATLVNKGLEIIEAHLLFDVPFDRIETVVHPGSVVHSMVEFVDGSTMLQASPPNMKLPIALGLNWPNRVPSAVPSCDWSTAAVWEFAPVDHQAFPAIKLAQQVGSVGATAPAVFNAANEVCVAAFVAGDLSFLGIVDTVATVVSEHVANMDAASAKELTLNDVLAADHAARAATHEKLDRR